MDKKEIKLKVAEVLAIMSSYSQERIVELIDYSESSNLQLISLLSASNKDTLAFKLCQVFSRLNQKELYDALFNSVKTAEKLIEIIYEKYA